MAGLLNLDLTTLVGEWFTQYVIHHKKKEVVIQIFLGRGLTDLMLHLGITLFN